MGAFRSSSLLRATAPKYLLTSLGKLSFSYYACYIILYQASSHTSQVHEENKPSWLSLCCDLPHCCRKSWAVVGLWGSCADTVCPLGSCPLGILWSPSHAQYLNRITHNTHVQYLNRNMDVQSVTKKCTHVRWQHNITNTPMTLSST